MFWFFIAFAFFFWLHGKKSSPVRGTSSMRGTAAQRTDDAEKMAPCAHCDVYIPLSEAISGKKGHVFCSEEHLRLSKYH